MSTLMVMCLTEVPVSGMQLLLRIIIHPADNILSPKEKNENWIASSTEGRLDYLYYGRKWSFTDGKWHMPVFFWRFSTL